MGMTTDERYTNVCIKYLQMNMKCVNYRDYIIERLNKYQKIQEVMDNRPDDDAKSNNKALGEIEVIMYGKDN